MWWNRSSEPSGLPEPGRVTDLRSTPPGVVPRYLQQWLLIGVALVMVGIIALSGAPTRPRPASGPPAGVPVVDPNQQRIEEYRRRIQEQAERLAAEQAELQATKDAVAAHAIPPAESTRPAGVPTAPMPRVREEERRRVADNVAFSRSGSAAPSASAAREAVPTARVPPAVTNAPQPAAALTPAGPSAEAAATAEPATVPQPARASPPEASATSSSDSPRYRLLEGTIIDTVLTNRLDGTFTGPVNCLVSVPVYASDVQHLLIPAGARVLGEARAVNAFGQSRLAVIFHRILLPNGLRVDLHGFQGLNQAGDLGLQDQVDRHYAEIFGTSLAIGAIAGFAQGGTSAGLDQTGLDAYRQGLAANVSQSSLRILDRFLNLLPTVTIREGHRIKVYLANDLALPAYRATPLPGGRQ